jgi:hypothetical protein
MQDVAERSRDKSNMLQGYGDAFSGMRRWKSSL